MKQLYFVRHGQTEWNAEGRMQGQLDSDLTELGRDQAETHGRFLAGIASPTPIEALIASPLTRTRQTAAIIAAHVELPVAFDDRIMEWNCGDWSGHLYADVRQRWADEWRALEADQFHYRGPGCENFPDMMTRARPFLDELTTGESRCVAIISHGLIGRIMVSMLMGFDEADTLSFHQANDTILRVSSADGTTRLDHFVAGEGPFPGVPF